MVLQPVFVGAAVVLLVAIPFVPELFPTRIRTIAFGISYNLGVCYFGGLGPVICEILFLASFAFLVMAVDVFPRRRAVATVGAGAANRCMVLPPLNDLNGRSSRHCDLFLIFLLPKFYWFLSRVGRAVRQRFHLRPS